MAAWLPESCFKQVYFCKRWEVLSAGRSIDFSSVFWPTIRATLSVWSLGELSITAREAVAILATKFSHDQDH